jgi:ATP-dependent DNA ligase
VTLTYQPNKRIMLKIKHERTADCVVVGYRVHKSGPDALGSLLLGLHDDGGTGSEWSALFGGLMPVGVVAAFPMARRRQLLAEVQPLVTDFDDHPWRKATLEMSTHTGRAEGNRWDPAKDLSFVPLRPERVVEVRYDYMEGIRFRHPAQFVRWRPDRDPASCSYAQFERPVRFSIADVLAGRVS